MADDGGCGGAKPDDIAWETGGGEVNCRGIGV